MSRIKPMFYADLTEFAASARKHIGNDWPIVVVGAFGDMSEHARDAVRRRTGQRYKLHSDYIPKGIKNYPHTDSQKVKAVAALKKYGDMNAAVYVRPSRSAKNSLAFMVDHEKGEDRTPQKEFIAVPTKTLKNKGYKTGRGRVRKRWKPQTLLQRFNESGADFDGRTTVHAARQKRRRYPGNAFIIKGRGGRTFIVRALTRKSSNNKRNLEFLYMFMERAEIKPTWGFVETVHVDVSESYYAVINRRAKRLPSYG